MINRMLLKSEAVCMQPVPMETHTHKKYDSSAFSDRFSHRSRSESRGLLTKRGHSIILPALDAVSDDRILVFSELGRKDGQ